MSGKVECRWVRKAERTNKRAVGALQWNWNMSAQIVMRLEEVHVIWSDAGGVAVIFI